jgi:hypothetical protein
MANTKKIFKEQINKLKKAFEKMMKPGKQQHLPQLVLQPVRNKNMRGC